MKNESISVAVNSTPPVVFNSTRSTDSTNVTEPSTTAPSVAKSVPFNPLNDQTIAF